MVAVVPRCNTAKSATFNNSNYVAKLVNWGSEVYLALKSLAFPNQFQFLPAQNTRKLHISRDQNDVVEFTSGILINLQSVRVCLQGNLEGAESCNINKFLNIPIRQ